VVSEGGLPAPPTGFGRRKRWQSLRGLLGAGPALDSDGRISSVGKKILHWNRKISPDYSEISRIATAARDSDSPE